MRKICRKAIAREIGNKNVELLVSGFLERVDARMVGLVKMFGFGCSNSSRLSRHTYPF